MGIMLLSFIIPIPATYSMSGEPPALENKFTIPDQYMIEKEDFDKITVKKTDCKEPIMEVYRYYPEQSILYSFCLSHKEAILYVPKGEKNHENIVE